MYILQVELSTNSSSQHTSAASRFGVQGFLPSVSASQTHASNPLTRSAQNQSSIDSFRSESQPKFSEG